MIRIMQLAAEIFDVSKFGFKGKVQFASQGRNNEHMVPMVEVKLDKVEYAAEIWKAFAEKRKKEKLTGCLKKVVITNSMNVGTRVSVKKV
jgi:hypothetical protein